MYELRYKVDVYIQNMVNDRDLEFEKYDFCALALALTILKTLLH